LAGVALIVILGLAAYLNTFSAPFTFDTVLNITENPMVRDVANIPSILAGTEGTFASRPLMHATFALNYHLDGLDPRGYHALNIALHLANGILLFFLILLTGKFMGFPEREVTQSATLSALLFTLHPVQTEAVTDIVNRSVLLATTFYLSGMILFLKAVTSEKRRGFFVAALFLASLLGMGSRENFATFPVMLFLYDLFFVSKFRLRQTASHWWAYVPVLLSLGYMAHIILSHTYDTGTEFVGAGLPHMDYFLTQFNVHWTYLRLLVIPVGQNLDYDYRISKTLFELPTLLSFIGYAGLWIAGLVFVKRRPVLVFPLLWFMVVLLPISFGVTLLDLRLDDVIFEHRLYLPGAAFFVIPGIALCLLLRDSRTLAAGVALAVLLPFALGGVAYARNSLWKTSVGIWRDAADKSPMKARPHNNLGLAYADEGQYRKAAEHYERALKIDPNYIESYNNLCVLYQELGEMERAIKYCRIATSKASGYAKAHFNLGNAYRMKGMLEKAVVEYELAADLGLPDAFMNLGIIYKNRGLLDKAIEYHRRAISLRPEKAAAHMNLGNALAAKGLSKEAIKSYIAAIRLKPDFMEAHFNLGNAYLRQGQPDKAIEHHLAATELAPGFVSTHEKLAEAYKSKGLHKRAEEHSRIAESLRQQNTR
jgi:tetratricopeptide (TPR) repeat protein